MFGAGCFWGVQKAFDQVEGVISTYVGYSGGQTKNPTYEEVCTDQTGHVEVVLIEYDPDQVSYDQLLKVFWKVHDPTTTNRQGPDVGRQYRSVIFYFTDRQKAAAEVAKDKLTRSGQYRDKIVTMIEPAGEFYKAEDYHQKYYLKNLHATC